MKRKWLTGRKKWLIVAGLMFGIFIPALDVRLKTVEYLLPIPGLKEEVRIGLVADLHSCNYGERQKTLTEAIARSAPDFLLMAGDMIDDEMPEQKAKEFMDWAGRHYPSYYVTGNHEYWADDVERIKDMVRGYGVRVLEGEVIPLSYEGLEIDLCGVNDTEEPRWNLEMQNCLENRRAEAFSILVSHRPEQIERYVKDRYSLIVAGHAHGGQWRIPFLLNGLIAPNQGLFPKYAGGRYDIEDSVMIVSRGLARESTRVPRIFNRPEYIILRLLPAEK